MLLGAEAASGTRDINRHNAYYFSTRTQGCVFIVLTVPPAVFGVRCLNPFCSLGGEASAFDSVVAFGDGMEKILKKKKNQQKILKCSCQCYTNLHMASTQHTDAQLWSA